MQKMEVLKDGEDCKVQIKALGEYAVKIHLKGGQEVGLKLAVRKR
jgi:ribosomal protein L9